MIGMDFNWILRDPDWMRVKVFIGILRGISEGVSVAAETMTNADAIEAAKASKESLIRAIVIMQVAMERADRPREAKP